MMSTCIAIQKGGIPSHYSMRALRSAMATAWTRVSASSLWMARLVSDLTVSVLSPIRAATFSVCRPPASSWRISRSRSDSGGVGGGAGHYERRGQRGIDERPARGHGAHCPQQVLRGRALQHVTARSGRDGVGEQALVAIGREDHRLYVGRAAHPVLTGRSIRPRRSACRESRRVGWRKVRRVAPARVATSRRRGAVCWA